MESALTKSQSASNSLNLQSLQVVSRQCTSSGHLHLMNSHQINTHMNQNCRFAQKSEQAYLLQRLERSLIAQVSILHLYLFSLWLPILSHEDYCPFIYLCKAKQLPLQRKMQCKVLRSKGQLSLSYRRNRINPRIRVLSQDNIVHITLFL